MKNKKTKQQRKTKITKNTSFSEIIMKKPGAAEILMSKGMHCIGCPMSMQESLEQGCIAHGMNNKEIKKLIYKLNKL